MEKQYREEGKRCSKDVHQGVRNAGYRSYAAALALLFRCLSSEMIASRKSSIAGRDVRIAMHRR